ncbi:XRE family transcriptional regulator [Bacteroides intestinalis]|jgi:transcriptional regulator with XRE-family HTH domain|uniref:helix-turn-helix domain-containing protein n=1 Tax=Bacteroides intestinalis TaxID=329854 RepID=UPI000E4FB740|nr:helix-turn-helix transcriptional regulator [Bacteroides intestinalis]RHA57658.1 XRE family transcriptional regulator [Bacteroides intestinalis]
MVFRDYVDSLPNVRLETINKIAELTYSSKMTVYRWLAGDIEPPMIKKKAIAEYIGKSVEELFPTTKAN